MRASVILLVFAAVLAVALAAGQYYVPRAYYIIDAEGHESPPVPLRRLRRSLYNQPHPTPAPGPNPYPGNGGSWSNSASGASAWSNAGSGSNGGGWYPPPGDYGASAPGAGEPTFSRGVSGTFNAGAGLGSGLGSAPTNIPSGQYVSSSASIGIQPDGLGYYDSRVSANY